MILINLAIFLGLMSGSEIAQSQELLIKIQRKGELIYTYNRRNALATDILLSKVSSFPQNQLYIPYENAGEHIVSFGHLSDDSKTFVVSYQVVFSLEQEDEAELIIYPEPKILTGSVCFLAKAVDSAASVFEPVATSYNYLPLREDTGNISVYFIPASSDPNIEYIGGDSKIIVSPNGEKIIETVILHKTVLERRIDESEDQILAGFHTHVLGNYPVETDVFYVLSSRLKIPEYIATERWMYKIETDGTIHYLGRTEDILKDKTDE